MAFLCHKTCGPRSQKAKISFFKLISKKIQILAFLWPRAAYLKNNPDIQMFF